MAEELSEYLSAQGIKVTYLHSEIKTIERAKILNDLRTQKFDCLVGINLLREGLDIPEVSLVVILDADKEGFLRSTTSLIQTIGRCARNINAKVIMYADTMTQSMKNAISESLRRRKIQEVYNRTYKIKPRSIVKEIRDGLAHYFTEDEKLKERLDFYNEEFKIRDIIAQMEKEMYIAAKNLQFEKAARLRDMIEDLKKARNEK
jgi:excinuclease ABC subunit B